MPNTSLKTLKISALISKGSLYALTFLLPIFFLPWTANVLDFNKQALLIGLVSISLFAWMVKILISGKVSINITGFHIPVGILFLVYTASTIISSWRYGSFWGWPLIASESLITIIGFLLLYLLVSNVLEKKDIFRLMAVTVVSGFVAMLYGALQLFGKFILPLDFAKSAAFNTIGAVNALGLFAAVLLPLTIILIMTSKRALRGVAIAALSIAILLLVLINFSVAWWVVVAGSALVMILGMQKRDAFDSRWLILPMFFLAIALFFSFFSFQIPGLAQRPVEVFMSQRSSLDVSWKALKEAPILGSGPGTFIYNFPKYKDVAFNQNIFWNVRFDSAGSKVLTVASTVGILGILSILSLIGSFVFFGIKFLLGRKKKSEETAEPEYLWLLTTGVFISLVSLSIGYFLYQSSMTLDFIFFLLLGSLIALLAPAKKEFKLKPSSLLTLVVTFAFTLVFIFNLGILILEGQRYMAEVKYLQGAKAQAQGQSDAALNNLERAASINPGVDLYWRELSQTYLQRINTEAAREDLTQEQVSQRVQLFINSAVNSVETAIKTNPKNVSNWAVKGFVYQSLSGVIKGVEDVAINSYEEALNLDPTNPYYSTQIGIVLLKKAQASEEKDKEKVFEEAKAQFEKAVELKSDYAPARFQLAMTYQAQGKTDEAIQELENTKQIAPFDVGLAFQIGLIYYQAENYALAQAELERAVGIDPSYANALYFLGLTYDKQGEKAKALGVFAKIAELNPNNEEVTKIINNLRNERPALEGLVEDTTPVVPIEEIPLETEEE